MWISYGDKIMTIGIYLLKFQNTNKVYVGQSVNIEYRYKKHIQALKRSTSNYKLQEAYKAYGIPELVILCDNLTVEELNSNEELAFSIFDSINNGFNICNKADIHEIGENNPGAKYSNQQIEEVFHLLFDLSKRYKDIEKITKVSISTIRHIANKEAHVWLSVKFPDQYAELSNLKILRKKEVSKLNVKNIDRPLIVSPDGIVYRVENIAEFAREHGLDSSSLAKVLNKRPKYKSHKGWKLQE